MSMVLIGSISSLMPSLASASAAKRRLPTSTSCELDRVRAVGRDAGQAVDLAAIERLGVVDRRATPSRNSSTRSGRQAMPRSPAAQSPAGRLCSTCVRPCWLQLLAQLGLVEIIGEQIFDAAEARGLGGGEAVEERQLAEQHRQIGGKFRHDHLSSMLCRQQLADCGALDLAGVSSAADRALPRTR